MFLKKYGESFIEKNIHINKNINVCFFDNLLISMEDHNILSITFKYNKNISINIYNNKDIQILLYILYVILNDKEVVPFSVELEVLKNDVVYKFNKFDESIFNVLNSNSGVDYIYINILECGEYNINFMKSQMFQVKLRDNEIESTYINNQELIRLGYANMCE